MYFRPGFCRRSVFSMTAEYNNGAQSCNCDFQGSLSFECEEMGGQCSCRPNVIGRKCNRCRTGFYGFPYCRSCDCPSTALCDPYTGMLDSSPMLLKRCRENVVGRTCDRCLAGYWAFPQCQLCNCDFRGTAEDICDQETSTCFCKENVYGRSCASCKPGTFNLEETNPDGCSKCFCFGKTSQCSSSFLYWDRVARLLVGETAVQNDQYGYSEMLDPWLTFAIEDIRGYSILSVATLLSASMIATEANAPISEIQDWKGTGIRQVAGNYQKAPIEASVTSYTDLMRMELGATGEDMAVYFSAPEVYLGNKLSSYGGHLSYTLLFIQGELSSGKGGRAKPAPDLILQGHNLTLLHYSLGDLSALESTSVSLELVERNFRLPSGSPATREQLMQVLYKLDGLYIRGNYWNPTAEARLSNISMPLGIEDFFDGAEPASSIEQCQCPPSYRGLSCEECAPGYYRAQTGPFGGFCVPCQCNGHSNECDPLTGKCLNCQHDTEGDYCQKCRAGYHGNATQGTPNDCLICACPLPLESNNFAKSCMVSEDGRAISCECKPGYYGPRCEVCAAGFYGQPEVPGEICKPCNCSGNIDPSDRRACDSVTGECLKCLGNTGCDCDQCGARNCDHSTGVCNCKENVIGDKCDRCAVDHWGFDICQGCRGCNCGAASMSTRCEETTGQCRCRPGVGGRTCDRCEPGYWNYTPNGCERCKCNPNYAFGGGCNPQTGQCECLPNVIGQNCDSCPHRWVLIPNKGCRECDTCTHDLLDVMDSMKSTIAPLLTEFETVSLSFFTTKRLMNINSTSDELRKKVEDFDPKLVNLSPPSLEIDDLTAKVDDFALSAEGNLLEATDGLDSSALILESGIKMQKEAEKNVKEVRDIVTRVGHLAIGFEHAAGKSPFPYKARYATPTRDLLGTSFCSPSERANMELEEAQQLLESMKEFQVPVKEDIGQLEDLRNNMTHIRDRLAELQNQSSQSLQKVSSAMDAINKVKATDMQRKLQDAGINAEESRNRTIEADRRTLEAEDLFKNATTNYQVLSGRPPGGNPPFAIRTHVFRARWIFPPGNPPGGHRSNRVEIRLGGHPPGSKSTWEVGDESVTQLETFKQELKNAAESQNGDLRRVVLDSQRHARDLERKAKDLDNLIADTRTMSENAVNAANSNKDIVKATEEAREAGKEARKTALDTKEKLGGVGSRSNESLGVAKELKKESLSSADAVQNQLAANLANGRFLTELTADTVETIKANLSEIQRQIGLLPALNDPDRLNADDALQASQKANETANSVLREVERLNLVALKVNRSSKAYQPMMLLALLEDGGEKKYRDDPPRMRELADRLTLKQAELKAKGEKVGMSIHTLKMKIAKAREQANRQVLDIYFVSLFFKIKVGLQFKPDTTLQLQNPEGLNAAATSTKLSLYFKTDKKDGFLAYLGNEEGTHTKLKNTNTDDFLALELEDGFATLVADLGSGVRRIPNTKKYVADDIWYRAIVERVGKTVELKIVEEGPNQEEIVHSVTGKTAGPKSVLNLDQEKSSLYVGGFPGDAKVQQNVRYKSFDGSIEGVEVNDQPVGLWNFKQANNNVHAEIERDRLKTVKPSTGLQFEGKGYAAIDRKAHQFRNKFFIKMNFKTYADNGLLLLVGKNKRFLSLELRDGRIMYQYDLGSGPVRSITDKTYSDGEWHTLQAQRQGREGQLTVDGENMERITSPGQEMNLRVSDYIYFGGYPGTHGYVDVTNIGFDGCIDDVGISNTPVDLSQNREAIGVSHGCPVRTARTVSFDSSAPGYVAIPKAPIGDDLQVTFKFKTLKNDGVLFHAGNEGAKDYVSISLSKGGLVMETPEYRLDTGPDHELNDEHWHYVTATKDSKGLRIDLDDFRVYELNFTEEKRGAKLTTPLFFGGVPGTYSPGTYPRSRFVGCIADTTVNGDLVNFANSTEGFGAQLESCPIADPVAAKSPLPTAPSFPEIFDVEVTFPFEDRGREGTTAAPTFPVPSPGAYEEDDYYDDLIVDGVESTGTTKKPAPTLPPHACALPQNPAVDSELNEHSGQRFGGNPESRQEFDSLPYKVHTDSEFSVEFKSDSKDGVIFYVSDNNHIDFIALYVKNGQVYYAFNCGSGAAVLSSERSYSDGKWHEVSFNREENRGILMIDDQTVAEGESQGNTKSINVNPPYFLGGLSQEAQNDSKKNLQGISMGFAGCLRNFRMKGRSLGEPKSSVEVVPCSEKVEAGVFFYSEPGYAIADETFHVGKSIKLKLQIKPRTTSGVLLSVTNPEVKDFMTLEMINGSVKFTVDNGAGPFWATYTSPEEYGLCDGEWHTISMVKTGNLVTLSVDDVFTNPGIGQPGITVTNTNHPLYVGGHPWKNSNIVEHFATSAQYVGCIRNVVVNESPLPLNRVVGKATVNTCPTI
ncbi:unnamed protein product [Darwinula stevensoni]|uniref:Uncharacterized protein n=1 Tax=Darwinula stevensoni TaxID=69355 RepID=A0A7R8WXW0_9CRUS|nr:unnamed protein product [Darwinula stevensoni]CAG0878724.1 unnamed protein product [Darwinula stevensoni]